MQQEAEVPARTEERAEDRPALKQVPLSDVARMSGEADGWYVAERDERWAIGLQSGGERYLVMLGAEALTFDSITIAVRYLRALIVPTGVEPPSASRPHLSSALADALSQIERTGGCGAGGGSSAYAGMLSGSILRDAQRKANPGDAASPG